VKYADDLVLQAKEETVLQGMIARLIEIGRCCGTGKNLGGKNYGNENLKVTVPNRDYGRLKKKNWRMWNISTIWVK